MNDKDVILTEGRQIRKNRDSQFDQIRGVQISSTNQPSVHLRHRFRLIIDDGVHSVLFAVL